MDRGCPQCPGNGTKEVRQTHGLDIYFGMYKVIVEDDGDGDDGDGGNC